MKSIALVSAVAIVAAIFSVAAPAQTGRPSTLEVSSASDAPRVAAADAELGSYGRYLMLNGATREHAVAAARNIDHPVPRKTLSSRSRTDAPASTRQ